MTKKKGPKLLLLDIETSPNTAYVWGLFKETVPIQRLIETGRVLCWAAKWVGSNEIMFGSEWGDGRKKMLRRMHKLLDEADAAIHYNGNRFDIPTLHKEFILEGFGPPAPTKHIDLYRVVRSEFKFPSNKLGYVAEQLGLGQKTPHEGFTLWVKCMAGDGPAKRKMERYNRQDVRLLESLYNKILPWINQHPNYALYTDSSRPQCTNCGSHHLQSRGNYYTKTMTYQRWHCQDCGKWMRERKNNTPKEKKEVTLV